VRQAISHAIDRTALVQAALAGNGEPANSFLPRGALGYDSKLRLPAHDLSLARSLLRQSSAPRGFTVEMEVARGDAAANTIASILEGELSPIGIKLNITQIDPATLFKNLETDKYHVTASGWADDIQDPDQLVSFALDNTQGSRAFYTWYDNPAAGRMARQAAHTTSAAARARLYYRIQEIWAQDQPSLALYYEPFVVAISSRVRGFGESPLGYFELQGVTK
jgi:peptide/nickel transport system substrate-binding protein